MKIKTQYDKTCGIQSTLYFITVKACIKNKSPEASQINNLMMNFLMITKKRPNPK